MSPFPASARRIAVAVAVALGGLAALGAAAQAGQDSTLRPAGKASVEVVPDAFASAVARCPAGKVASGGFAAPGFSKESSPVVRVNSGALGKRDWKVDAVSFGDGGGDDGQGTPPSGAPIGTSVSYAYCAKLPGKLTTAQATVEIGPNSGAGATATCPRGRRAISGGFASPNIGAPSTVPVIVLSSRRDGSRSWTVEGIAAGDDEGLETLPGQMTAIAYCLKRPPQILERSLQASVGPDQVRTIDVACPAGTKALSGGFDANFGPLSENTSASGAIESYRMRGASGWTTTSVSIDDGVGSTMTGFAYCAKLS